MRSFLHLFPNIADGFVFNLVPANVCTGKHNEQEEPKDRHEYDDGKGSHK